MSAIAHRSAPPHCREHPTATAGTLVRFSALNKVQREVCLMLAAGIQSHHAMAQLGLSLGRWQLLRAQVLRHMDATSQVELARRMNSARPATAQGKTAAAGQSAKTILLIDTEQARVDAISSALEADGHRVLKPRAESQVKHSLLAQHVDVCLISHATQADLLPMLRACLPLKDRPVLVQYALHGEEAPRLRDCGDTIAADIPWPCTAEHLAQVVRYCTFEDVALPAARSRPRRAAIKIPPGGYPREVMHRAPSDTKRVA